MALKIDRKTWETAPLIGTDELYRSLVQRVLEQWKALARATRMPDGRDGLTYFMQEKIQKKREGLRRADGLSETKELQFAFTGPQWVENAIAAEVQSGDWPRTHPRLFEIYQEEFQCGVIGQFGPQVKAHGKRDRGCALGEGDKD